MVKNMKISKLRISLVFVFNILPLLLTKFAMTSFRLLLGLGLRRCRCLTCFLRTISYYLEGVDEETAFRVREVLKNFCSIIGPKINDDKSRLIFSPNTLSDIRDLFQSTINVCESPNLGDVPQSSYFT